ncbi:MAG: LPS export ABC transporter periplasmic protein LptC [Alphaproteobacteria bacterium]|nr:LPS export ABC transporter periplasmic protein LptC [Alphaproteobacteria bacterium]
MGAQIMKIENRDVDTQRLDRLAKRATSVVRVGTGYSRFVRFMRLALPLAAVGILAYVFTRSDVNEHLITPVSEENASEQRISQNELLNPRFQSMDRENQPYEIIAERAVQGEKNKDLIMLEKPRGKMTMSDGVVVTMESNTGAYRQDSKRFFLQGEVVLNHAEGYTLKSEEAHIDLEKNFAWSEKDVKGQGPELSIDAKGVRANADTGEIVFTGPAKLILEQ